MYLNHFCFHFAFVFDFSSINLEFESVLLDWIDKFSVKRVHLNTEQIKSAFVAEHWSFGMNN